MKDKKAITRNVIIGIIIMLMCASVILLFLSKLPYRKMVDKEACHQSVVLRDQKILQMGEKVGFEIPLRCKTEYITIKTTDEEEIKRKIANSMYDCWWMLGEGKLEFFDESGWDNVKIGLRKSDCIFCSVIDFDDKVKKEINLLDYLEKTKVSNKDFTYLEYFANEPETKLPVDLKVSTLQTNQQYAVIFMGFEGGDVIDLLETDLKLATGAIGVATAGSFFLGGGIKGVGKLFSSLGKTGWWGIAALGGLIGTQLGFELANAHAAAMYCDGEKKGCYSLMLVPYDLESVSKYCKDIASIP